MSFSAVQAQFRVSRAGLRVFSLGFLKSRLSGPWISRLGATVCAD